MTNREKVLNYLQGRGWVLGVELQRHITEKVSPATIDRTARQLAEDGEIERRRTKDNLVEYQLKREELRLFWVMKQF